LFSPTGVLNKTLQFVAAFYFAYMLMPCQFCGTPSTLVHVHGHYQCSVCGINALPCCDGDNCHTNEQLATASLTSIAEEKSEKQNSITSN
jgi:hypothetical protein